jgi:transposase-like protein
MTTHRNVDAEEFRGLWESGTPVATIARRFGVKINRVYKLRRQFGIAERDKVVTKDPTPSQIAELAAALKVKHLQEMRALG